MFGIQSYSSFFSGTASPTPSALTNRRAHTLVRRPLLAPTDSARWAPTTPLTPAGLDQRRTPHPRWLPHGAERPLPQLLVRPSVMPAWEAHDREAVLRRGDRQPP